MMSNIPKLRFPEFSGEWEEKNFYEVFDILQNNTFSRDQLNNENGFVRNIHYGDVLIKYGDYIDCQKEELPFINLENNLSKYEDTSYVKNGDIIIADTAEDYTAGKVTEICNVKDYKILSGLHTFLCRTKFEFASKFLGYKLNSSSYHNQIAPLVAGTKVYSINRKAIGETTITYPSKAEQQKIADFLSNVDSIITAETKIQNALQKKKKALMQKLFTRQLRFKSDDGTDFPTWKEKKFSEVFIYHQTNTFSRNMLNYEEGDTYNIHYGDILVKFGSYIDFDNSKIPFINSDVTLNKFVSDSFLKDGDIIIADTAEDESAGKVSEVYNINNKKALSGLHTILCRPKQIFASKYLGYFMNSNVYHKQIVKLLVGTKVLSINKSVIADTIIQIPCLAEQQKIADCLSSLDSLIQNQQKVVTTWQQRKKALLQQMFI